MLPLLSLAAAAAPEAPNHFELARGEAEWTFTYSWRDPGDGRQQLAFALPAAPLLADREEETWFPRRQMYEDVAKDLRAFGRGLQRVDLVVAIEDGGLAVRASGRGDVRGALKEAEVVRDDAIDAWLAANAFLRMEDGITFDHARLAADYADDLAPVARALRAGTSSDRAFVARALSFVQAIPYEARKRRGGDPGYRRPLALLTRNRGDCDSKTVLFLALLRAELPDLPLTVIYVPEHALAGVGLPREGREKGFEHEDVDYLYVEPVGPAQAPIGVPRPEDRRAGKRGEVHAVPAG